MRIIKLSATDSTNLFLRELVAETTVKDMTTVVVQDQTKGRGQMGASWQAQPSKNLTFSVYKRFVDFSLDNQFTISMVVALSIVKALEGFNIPKLSIKWPNDILSANKKIGGVLIENVIKKSQVDASIIGIGLNINQKTFIDLPQASSLLTITGMNYDLDEVLQAILNQLESYFKVLEVDKYEVLKTDYESYLFRKNKPSTFKTAEGLCSGFIKGVSKEGLLQVLLEDNKLKTFDLKTIKLLY